MRIAQINSIIQKVYWNMDPDKFLTYEKNNDDPFKSIQIARNLSFESEVLQCLEQLGFLIYKRKCKAKRKYIRQSLTDNNEYFSQEFIGLIRRILDFREIDFNCTHIGALKEKAFSPYVLAVLMELETIDQKNAFVLNAVVILNINSSRDVPEEALVYRQYFDSFIARVGDRLRNLLKLARGALSKSLSVAISKHYKYVQFLVLKNGGVWCLGISLPVITSAHGPYTKRMLLMYLKSKLEALFNNCRNNQTVFDGYAGHIVSINTLTGLVPKCDVIIFFNNKISDPYASMLKIYRYWVETICKSTMNADELFCTPEQLFFKSGNFIESGPDPSNLRSFISSIVPYITRHLVIRDLHCLDIVLVTKGQIRLGKVI